MDVTCLELAIRNHEVKGHTWKLSYLQKTLYIFFTNYSRITESLGLKETSGDHTVQPSHQGRVT